jgi:hypothetical protein
MKILEAIRVLIGLILLILVFIDYTINNTQPSNMDVLLIIIFLLGGEGKLR